MKAAIARQAPTSLPAAAHRVQHVASIIAVLFFQLLGCPALQADYSASVATQAGSGLRIELASPLEYVPAQGSYPLQVRITNVSGASREIRVSSSVYGYPSGSQRLEWAKGIQAPPGQSTHELVVPLGIPDIKGAHYYSQGLGLNFSGYGLDLSGTQQHIPGRGGNYSETLESYRAISQELTDVESVLQKDAKAAKRTFQGSLFSPASLPVDWRGYFGIEQLVMTGDEFDSLAPAQQQALERWLLFGGRLFLVGTAEHSERFRQRFSPVLAADSLAQVNSETQLYSIPAPLFLGYGRVSFIAQQSSQVPAAQIAQQLESTRVYTPFIYESGRSYESSNWSLGKNFEGFGEGMGIVLVLLALYALLVGPVNVLFLAPEGRRMWIYLTTPALAVSATVVLYSFILLRDGTGGVGRRSVAVLLDPVRTQALLFQEQAYQSGLLLNSDFALPEDVELRPRDFEVSYSQNQGTFGFPQQAQFSRENERVFGDWFVNRRIAGHSLAHLITSRGRIEISGVASRRPIAHSYFRTALRALVFRDRDGRYWKSDAALRAGQAGALSPVPPHEVDLNLCRIISPNLSSDLVRELASDYWSRDSKRSGFCALLADSREFAIETLPSISWQDTEGLIFGPVIERTLTPTALPEQQPIG